MYFLDGKRISHDHPSVIKASVSNHSTAEMEEEKIKKAKPKLSRKKPTIRKPRASSTLPKVGSHPKWEVMIGKAINDTNNRVGTSPYAIGKYIAANYAIPDHILKTQLRIGIRRLLAAGKIIKNKGKYRLEKIQRERIMGLRK